MRSLFLVLFACSRETPPLPTAPTPTGTPSVTTLATPAQTTPVETYDLAADRDRIVALAREELGPKVSTQVTKDVFALVGAPGWSAPSLAASVDLTVRAIDAFYTGRFDTKPERAIAVYLFADAATYQGYCVSKLGSKCDSPFGVYFPDRRRIVMNAGPGLGTLTHELVHPIVEADFPHAPTWIDEGLASLFEAPYLPKPGEIHGTKNWRLPRLLSGMAAADEASEARIEFLFGLPNTTFRNDREKLHYATARYFCQWLDSKGWLWSFYQSWRDHVADDPTGERAFTQVTGMTPAQANVIWTPWVKAL